MRIIELPRYRMKVLIVIALVLGVGGVTVWQLRARGGGAGGANAPAGEAAAEPILDCGPGGLPGFGGGGELRGVAEAIGGPPYRLRWQVRADKDDRVSIENNPVIAGDVAYVADMNGTLHALALKDGAERWAYKCEGGFVTAPLVVGGRIYLGDLDGLMLCVSVETGKKIWTFDGQSGIHSSANVSPDGKLILFGTDGAQVFALDAEKGTKVWEGRGGDKINACPAVGHGVALFTGCDERLLALDLKDGHERFAFHLTGPAPGSPTVLADRIVAATGEGTVIALTPDGKEELWRYNDLNEEQAPFYSSPASAGGLVVLGCRDRQVHAIDAKTGKRAWAFATRGDVDATPTISGGRVFVGSNDKTFYVLNLKTGKKVWEFTAGRSITAGAAVGRGVFVFGDTAGNIYCFEAGK